MVQLVNSVVIVELIGVEVLVNPGVDGGARVAEKWRGHASRHVAQKFAGPLSECISVHLQVAPKVLQQHSPTLISLSGILRYSGSIPGKVL